MTDARGPLAGVVVVDLGAFVAGPAAGAILADWGADVIKVEPPAGDPMRHTARFGPDGINPLFELDNRNKRSLAVDLTDPDGRRVFDAVLACADVLVTNLRAATLASWSLSPADLGERHPHLIVATLSGYGDDGPDRDRPSYDLGGFWARSGLAHVHTVEGEPVPLRGAWGDHMSALSLAAGVCAALAGRARDNEVRRVSTSLLRNGVYGVSQDANVLSRLGRWFPSGRRQAPNPLFNAYATSDGRWLWLLGLQPDRHWPSIAVALDHPEWLADERFTDHAAQRQHRDELRAAIAAVIETKTLADWAVVLEEHQVWWEPVATLEEALADEQVRAAGGIVPVRVPGGTTPVEGIATPVDFDGRSVFNELPPPEVGEHGDEILAASGIDEAERRALRERRVIR